MKHFNIWIILVSVLFSWGCEGLVEDLDESKLPKTESKLVVSCYISPQSPVISVLVSESQPLLGPATYNPVYITNAEVVLSGDAGQIRIPYRDSTWVYAVESSAFKIEAGKTYTLTVSDGKRSVKATCTVPVNVPRIENVSIENVPSEALGYSMLRIKTKWEDITGEKNYYSVRGYLDHEITVLRNDPVTAEVKPVPEKYKYELFFYPPINNLFSDANLDGTIFVAPGVNMGYKQRDTVAYRDKNNVEHSFDNQSRISEVRVEVMNMDENYYQFLRSTSNYKDTNKFTEPTPVYSNVEGGLGCFASFNAAVWVDRKGW